MIARFKLMHLNNIQMAVNSQNNIQKNTQEMKLQRVTTLQLLMNILCYFVFWK